MKLKILTAAAVAAIGLAAGAANAQGVDQRHWNQQERIHEGIRSGEVTPGERYRLERQQRSIHAQEARMRWRNGGHLSPRQRWILQHRENRASAHIYRSKHNYRHY